MTKKSPNRTPREITLEREKFIWDRRVKYGWSHLEIAEEWTRQNPRFRITRQGVTKAMARLRKRFLEEAAADRQIVKTEQLATLQALLQEAMNAWHRSKETSETHITEKSEAGSDGGKHSRMKAQVKKEEQVGDPRYLAEARNLLADIRKLLGLDVDRLMSLDLTKLPIDQLEAIAAGEDPVEVLAKGNVT